MTTPTGNGRPRWILPALLLALVVAGWLGGVVLFASNGGWLAALQGAARRAPAGRSAVHRPVPGRRWAAQSAGAGAAPALGDGPEGARRALPASAHEVAIRARSAGAAVSAGSVNRSPHSFTVAPRRSPK